jgi:hypothetical protein
MSEIIMTFDDIVEQLTDKFNRPFEDNDIRNHLNALVGEYLKEFIHEGDYGDKTFYCACTGITWKTIHMIDDQIKKQILLFMIPNPDTVFILQQAQSGKMKICAEEMKKWSEDATLRPVAIFVTQNDKTLTDQSAEGIKHICGTMNIKLFILSSNSKTSFDDIKIYCDAYATDNSGEYKMPIIVALSNTHQHLKNMKIIEHISRRVQNNNSLLRYGIIFDEADETYPQFRNKLVTMSNGRCSYSDFINTPEHCKSVYRQVFVTATEGDLLDDDYPECANAYSVVIGTDNPEWRGFHSPYTIIKLVPVTPQMTSNIYVSNIIDNNLDYFITPIRDNNGNIYYRKIIALSDMRNAKMIELANKLINKEMYVLIFNQTGITLYRQNSPIKKFKVKGCRFSERLYYIYITEKLNDHPLVIIGRKKVDRGIGFHCIPRLINGGETMLDGENGQISIDGVNGLIWTDMILGRIDNPNSARQKAGRLQGIIAHCPQYTTITYWTDKHTSDIIINKNTILDIANKEHGSSMIQAMEHAKHSNPEPISIVQIDLRKEVPVILNVEPDIISKFDKSHPSRYKTPKEKHQAMFSIIESMNPSLYNKISTYTIGQMTTPGQNTKSYKKHIIDTVRNSHENKRFIIDITSEQKTKNIINCYIDTRDNRIVICIWNGGTDVP